MRQKYPLALENLNIIFENNYEISYRKFEKRFIFAHWWIQNLIFLFVYTIRTYKLEQAKRNIHMYNSPKSFPNNLKLSLSMEPTTLPQYIVVCGTLCTFLKWY